MRDLVQLSWAITDDDAFEICFNPAERLPLFKLALYRSDPNQEDPVEQLLEDPMSELFVSLVGLKKVNAVFRPFASQLLAPLFSQYLQEV